MFKRLTSWYDYSVIKSLGVKAIVIGIVLIVVVTLGIRKVHSVMKPSLKARVEKNFEYREAKCN